MSERKNKEIGFQNLEATIKRVQVRLIGYVRLNMSVYLFIGVLLVWL